MRKALVAAIAAALIAAVGASSARAGWPKESLSPAFARFFHATDRHIRRANRYLTKCLAATAPSGEEVHNYDVAQGEFVAWWGAAEFQAETIQVWWAHWPKRDHDPGLAGVIFSTYGVPVPGSLYSLVDRCTSQAVMKGSS